MTLLPNYCALLFPPERISIPAQTTAPAFAALQGSGLPTRSSTKRMHNRRRPTQPPLYRAWLVFFNNSQKVQVQGPLVFA